MRLGEPHQNSQGVFTVRTPVGAQTGGVLRRRLPRVARLLTVLALTVPVAGLVACTAEPAGGPSGRSTPPPAASAPASPSATPEARETLRSGDVELTVTSARTPEVRTDAGATTLTVEVGPGAPATLAVGTGSLVVNADGTVTVHDDDGDPVAALTAPSGGASFVTTDGEGVRLDADVAVTSDVTLGTRALESAVWGDREGGRSLAVAPAGWARTAGVAGEDLVWAELFAAEPEAGSATMRDQLTCHVLGAPGKETWNLEPWRPDVGLVAVLAARCNPTADEPG
jgi:hypothetical protein